MPKRPSTRSSSPPVQTGLPSPRTPSGSALRRLRMALGARSPRRVRSARTPLALWVSSRLPLSRSTIWTTGSYRLRHLTQGQEKCVPCMIRSISPFRPNPPHSLVPQDCACLTYHNNPSPLPSLLSITYRTLSLPVITDELPK